MKTMGLSEVFRRGVWVVVLAAGTCWLFLGQTVAGPVVGSTDDGVLQDTPTDEGSALPNAPLPLEDSNRKKGTATRSVPSSAPSSSSTGGQPRTAYQPGPQVMPLPPTASGYPGAQGQGGGMADPYGAMPLPPTAYGPYDSSNPNATSSGSGMVRPGVGSNMGGAGGMAQQTGGSPGYGYGFPATPTPTPSLGGAAMADPSFGRYESPDIREATAPRQPASLGQSQAQVLRGGKPFAQSQISSSPYSPYMQLNNARNWTQGSNAYYEYVKPQLEQQQENRQVNREVRGLTDTARAGYQSLESLKQRPGNTIQGTAPRNPATFMNTGQYYPGFQRK
jgi:hypothetical protein